MTMNLCDEEEFRGINHTEPIHIFLKLKPFTEEDLASNQNQKCNIIHSDTTIKINILRINYKIGNYRIVSTHFRMYFNQLLLKKISLMLHCYHVFSESFLAIICLFLATV
jgi:hypothetical protein